MARSFSIVFLLSILPRSSGARSNLRSEAGNRRDDSTLGELLATAAERIRVEANSGSPSHQNKFFEGLVSKLDAGESVLQSPQVSEAVNEANSLANHALVGVDPVCVRDWGSPCPDGWLFRRGIGACMAPASYDGACQHAQSFGSSDAFTKAHFADQCKAPWPCVDAGACEHGRNYESCPTGWINNDGAAGSCEAAPGISVKCSNAYSFDGMTIAAMQELGSACGLEWPCNVPCAQDYRSSCPEEWAQSASSPGLCLAPAIYAGPCPYSVNTTGMTVAQKESFAARCAVDFPCLRGA